MHIIKNDEFVKIDELSKEELILKVKELAAALAEAYEIINKIENEKS